jgi:hypothetical protein
MMTPDACSRAREHLASAVAGLKSAAASLRAAAAVLVDPIAGVDPGELQTHAAVTGANAAGIERLEERIARLLSTLEGRSGASG